MSYDQLVGPWPKTNAEYNPAIPPPWPQRQQANTTHHASMMMDQDGVKWMAWTELDLAVGGGSTMVWGPYVSKFVGGSWVQVPGPATGGVVSRLTPVSSPTAHPVHGVSSNFSGNPQICQSSTHVYVCQGQDSFNFSALGGAGMRVWRYDKSAGTWEYLPLLSTLSGSGMADFWISADPTGDAVFAAYIQSNNLNCYKFPNSTASSGSWTAIGTNPLSRPSPDSTSYTIYGFEIDSSDQPVILLGTSTATASQAAQIIYHWNGSSWDQKVLNMEAFGVSLDYLGTQSAGSKTATHRFGSLSKFVTDGDNFAHVMFSLNKRANTGLPLADEPAGTGIYCVIYNATSRAFEPFEGDVSKGHVYTTAASVTAGASTIGTHGAGVTWVVYKRSVARPITDASVGLRAVAMGDFNNSFGVPEVVGYDQDCAGWHAISFWTGFLSTDDDKQIELDPTTAGSMQGQPQFERGYGSKTFYIGMRWWNGKTAFALMNGAPVTPISTTNYDAVANYLTGGNTQLFDIPADDEGYQMTIKMRVRYQGAGKDADFACYDSVTPFTLINRMTVGNANGLAPNTIAEYTMTTSYVFGSGRNLRFRWGPNTSNPATNAELVGVDIYPTNTIDYANMETRLYRKILTEDYYSCPTDGGGGEPEPFDGPIHLDRIRFRAWEDGGI